MSTRILPAASLSSARRLPAAQILFRASNDLICTALWSIGRAIFRGASNFLRVLRERRVPALPRRVVLGAGFDPTFAGRGLLALPERRFGLQPVAQEMAVKLKLVPSEYWRRQCRAAFQFARIGTKLIDD